MFIQIGDDGIAREYSEEFDVVIHAENEEDQQKIIDDLKRITWTPVSEGLPEPWASVLITFSGEYGKLIADHAVGTGSYDGSNGWFIDEIQGYTDRLTVSAWMNLPESYKEE